LRRNGRRQRRHAMSNMAIDQVLAQIRSMSAQTTSSIKPAAQALSALQPGSANAAQGPGFAELFKQGIDSVNGSQVQAGAMAQSWERGDPGADLETVMIQSQKAAVSFRALTEVRNRLVSAYQDVMNMSI
jgi:flagellar hook-basal body complex protein FliE